MRIAVFLGPSLPAAEAERLLNATYLPPARQGDVYRVARDHRPRIIGIVDGYFHQVAAVWHREILFALSEGIHVFGAASMGALRAAELHPFGMRGVGAIFEAYRDGRYPPYPAPFDRDEEVAIEHGPPESGYISVTDALVDMRATFAEAEIGGLLSAHARLELVKIAAQIHFSQRTYRAVVNAASAARIGGVDLARLEPWLRSNRISQKARDASRMLAQINTFASTAPAAFSPTFVFERALVWERFRAGCDEEAAFSLSELDEQILEELRLDPPAFARAFDEARLHRAALQPRAPSGAAPPAGKPRAGLDSLRARHALPRRADLDGWMRDNAVDDAAMHRLIAQEAGLASLPPAPPRALLDSARAAGLIAPLRRRALDKRQCLADAPEARRSPTPLESAALTAWWFAATFGEEIPDDLGRRARSLGFAGEQSFLAALWRERLYLRLKEANK